MFRVTPPHPAPAASDWVLEGSLTAEAIQTLDVELGLRGVMSLDLSGVTFIDVAAAKALRSLQTRGAVIREAPMFIHQLLDQAERPDLRNGDSRP